MALVRDLFGLEGPEDEQLATVHRLPTAGRAAQSE
jgi:hypothetical protein